MAAGDYDSIFGNLPGSPRRPKPPPNRGLMQTMFPVDPRAVAGGLVNQATEGAGNLTAGAARRVGLPNPDLLGRDVTAFLQSPTFGGGMSPMAAAPAMLAAAPLAAGARLAPEARTAEEIATGARAAQAATTSDAAAQAARAAQASPGQAALDQMVRQSQAAAPGAGETAAKGGITAYHGSPYSFDRFDISKIGTGEGAAAYGQGLYFAENEEVAKNYRDRLAKGFSDAQGNPLPDETQRALEYIQPKFKASGDYAAGLQDAIGRMQDQADFYRRQYGAGANLYDSAAERLKAVDPNNLKPAGSMYQVNINANPEHFLDWDKSFAEQSPKVQFAVENLWLKRGNDLGGDLPPFVRSEGRDTGQFIHNAIDAAYPRQGAGSALQSEGVPGIKYLDQGSRGAGGEGGTQNYVTFSDDMIDILRKYGLAGLGLTAGAGALSASGQSPVSSPAEAAPPPPQGMTLGAQPWSP